MPDPLQSALSSAAFASLQNSGWLRVSGADRVRWLNGMVTNSIQTLTPGQGCYNFVLNAQGRIQADCMAWLLPDSILLQTPDPETLATLFDRFIIMDDVELTHISMHGLLLAGPEASVFLTGLGLPAPDPLTLVQVGDTTVLHAHSPLVPRYEIWSVSPLPLPELPELTPENLASLRLLEGTPLVGLDIRDKDMAQETGQTRALHFSKGCYLGQEIVERIRSRGQVHRTLHGFVLEGELPAPGTSLLFEEKPVGELTSIAAIHCSGPLQLALGIVRREALERASEANPITYAGGTARPETLPYKSG